MMNQNMVGKRFSQEKFNQMFQEHRTARPRQWIQRLVKTNMKIKEEPNMTN